MSRRNVVLMAGAALALVAGLAVAATTVWKGRGKFTDVDSTRREGGHWKVGEVSQSNRNRTRVAARIEAQARNLDVSNASSTSPPNFHVWLVDSSGNTSADFGAMRVNRRGNAQFIFDTRRASFPNGVTSISGFTGGTIEIRDHSNSGTIVLSATLP